MSAEPFSHVVRVDRIPPSGKHIRIEAKESERRGLAEALGIVEVASLTADFDVRRLGNDAVGVSGTIAASVTQEDVVTLEPVSQTIAEAIDVMLMPAEPMAPGKRRSARPAGAEPGDATAEDRDVYRDGQIDLGAIAREHLALGLDPYPRAPGVKFPGHVEDDPTRRGSPFAALQRLKTNQK